MLQSHARVVIIGGGAVGASCLYHLALAGISDCLLIEKDELTSGSTWHAAGNIPTYATSWLGMRAGNYAWRLYSDLGEAVGSPITYRHTGAFWPAHTRDRMDLFQHLVGLSKSAGFDLSMLSPSEMEAMHPYYRAGGDVVGGIHDPYEGDIDPAQLTQALARGARQAGAEISRFTTVNAIGRSPGGEWIVDTDKGAVTCEVVVNATGFYGADIAAMVGQALPVATLEHQYMVTEPLDALRSCDSLFPLVRDPDIRFYLRREGAGLLFGSYGHPGRLAFPKGNPKSFAHSLFEDSPDDIIELVEAAMAHIPLLGDAGVQRFVNGPIGYSPDALPLCGPAYGLPNFYHACGIQIGITHSAAAGKAISEWITAGETEWDYAAWDPRRFGDWANADYARSRIAELYDLQYAIPYPHRIIQSGRPVQRTPLYDTLKERGAVFGQVAGWERAFWFGTGCGYDAKELSFRHDEPWRLAVRRECLGVRDFAGIMDHGGFTRYEVTGPGAADYLGRIFCTPLPMTDRIRLGYMLTPKGMIWSEATIARLENDRFLLCGPTLAELRDHDWLTRYLPTDGSVTLKRGSHRDAALLLMGPQSRRILSELTDANLKSDAMPWMSVREIEVADIHCTAMRLSYVGELGWELHLESSQLVTLYDRIRRSPAAADLVDFGSHALNALRIEKAYHGWGSDIGTEYTLFDAGLERFLKNHTMDYIGGEAVTRQREIPPQWHFVQLRVQSDIADPLPGDPILLGKDVVGYVTSGATGFRTGYVVALGYVQSSVTSDTSGLSIQVLGHECPATICKEVIYDPLNARCRS